MAFLEALESLPSQGRIISGSVDKVAKVWGVVSYWSELQNPMRGIWSAWVEMVRDMREQEKDEAVERSET